MVDLDIFMEILINNYIQIKKNSKGLDMVFQTIDIDKDKSVQLYEFLCALFYIQQLDLSNLERAEKIFMQSWDRID